MLLDTYDIKSTVMLGNNHQGLDLKNKSLVGFEPTNMVMLRYVQTCMFGISCIQDTANQPGPLG